MKKETDMIDVPARLEITIPSELLNVFKGEIRINPIDDNPKGLIIFNLEMLISVLERGNDIERMEMLKTLKNLDNAHGKLVVMQ